MKVYCTLTYFKNDPDVPRRFTLCRPSQTFAFAPRELHNTTPLLDRTDVFELKRVFFNYEEINLLGPCCKLRPASCTAGRAKPAGKLLGGTEAVSNRNADLFDTFQTFYDERLAAIVERLVSPHEQRGRSFDIKKLAHLFCDRLRPVTFRNLSKYSVRLEHYLLSN
jgi:hypothetical protein